MLQYLLSILEHRYKDTTKLGINKEQIRSVVFQEGKSVLLLWLIKYVWVYLGISYHKLPLEAHGNWQLVHHVLIQQKSTNY